MKHLHKAVFTLAPSITVLFVPQFEALKRQMHARVGSIAITVRAAIPKGVALSITTVKA